MDGGKHRNVPESPAASASTFPGQNSKGLMDNKLELCGWNLSQTAQNKCAKLLRRHGASGIMIPVCTQCVLEHKVFISVTSRFDGGTLTHPSANSSLWV